jgi:glycosyltransferase involved in cell wall biosynthesis
MNSASSTKPTCVVVLGMHRSGTSALTRCLNLVGMDLGSHLLSPAKMNAKGFWEHGDAVRINDQLLEALGLYWYDLRPLPAGWMTSAAADTARDEIRMIVKRDFDGVPLWGLKDPRLCRLAPLWIDVLEEMDIRIVTVLMIRSPVEVAESLSRFPDYRLTAPLSIPQGVLLWAQDLAESVIAAHSVPKVMVDYEHLLSEPVAVVSKIGSELGLVWPILPAERSEAILSFLDVGLRTHRSGVSADRVPPLVTELVDASAAIVENSSLINWSHLTKLSAQVIEQLQALSYLGAVSGFNDRGYAELRAVSAGWVPNAALYYATGDDPAFSKDRCVVTAVPWGRTQLDLTLPANAGTPVRLRFDPLDRRGAYVLHSLVLFDRTSQVVWDWSDKGDSVGMAGIDTAPSLTSAGRLVAYTGDDPQISIELPQDIVERRVARVRVDMECLDAGWLSDEISAQTARADFECARVMEHEEALRRQAEAHAEEHRRQAEAHAEEHRRQAEACAEQLCREKIAHQQTAAESARHQLRIDQLAEQLRIGTESSRREIDRLMAIQLTQSRELRAIHVSTMWRVMVRLRVVMSRVPVGVRIQSRRVLKAAWWCITPWRLPARLQFLRHRRAMQAWQQREALHTVSPPPPTTRPTVLSFVPAADALDTAAGYYQLSHGDLSYTYVPPRPPTNLEQELASMLRAPRFSVVVPVYNTPSGLLDKLVNSVLAQWYPHWELILVNDNSSLEHVGADLDRLRDSRIIVVHLTENKRIALATNEGIARAIGDYVVFADHDDELTPDCLYELARCIDRENPDFIYSDEDKIDERGQYVQPFFKPSWSPDTMMSTMYTCHVSCVRRELVNELGGLRSEYDGCQDWDFILRVVERTDRIAHIPKVLYHWRIIPSSVASGLNAKPHVIATSKRVRDEAIARRGLSGVMEPVEEIPGYFRAVYSLRDDSCISVIIPSKDNHRILKQCIDSIESKSTYRNFEIVVIDHGSTDPTTLQYVEGLRGNARIKVLSYDKPLNYAAINNLGVQTASGELVLFLSDSVEVLVPDWLERLGGYAQLPHIGAVGVKLLDQDGTLVQQVGIVNLADGPSYGFSGVTAQDHGYFARAVLEYNWLAVSGDCLMVERSKFERVGGFDEGFPTGCHDVDFCFLLAESGYYNLVSPAVKLINHESHGYGSDDLSLERQVEIRRETQSLYQKHPQFYKYDPFHSPNLAPNDVRFGLPQ